MKPFRHARNSVKKHGGIVEDYIDIHNFLDVSKSTHADVRHRAMLHHSLGCYIVERLFGEPMDELERLTQKFDWSEDEVAAILNLVKHSKTHGCTTGVNTDGVRFSVRDIAEEHILEDLGRIPNPSEYLNLLPKHRGFGGRVDKSTKSKTWKLDDD